MEFEKHGSISRMWNKEIEVTVNEDWNHIRVFGLGLAGGKQCVFDNRR
jgi:hypothetical protein